MAKYFISLGIFFSTNTDNLFGQSLQPIQLDRPDQTECPFITPTKHIQIENGFTYENIDRESKSLNYPSTLWKYGVNEKFELRLITELVTERNAADTKTGLLPITIGFKTQLLEEKGILPKTSFIGHITTSNIGSKQFQTKHIAPSFRFTMQHSLASKISLAYNLGVEWNGENAEQTYIYTLATGFTLTEKLGCYAEVYGFIPTMNKTDNRFDTGFTYLVNNDFMLDLSGGIGLSENSPKNYFSYGLSYRFKAIN